MGFLDYAKIKKLVLVLVGFFPMFILTIALALGFNWLGGAIVGLFATFILVIIGDSILTKNNWVRAVQRDGIFLMFLNSTGIIQTGIARLINNPMGKKLFSFKQGNEETSRLYDREVGWTLKEPMEGTIEYFVDKATGKKKIMIILDEETYAKGVFFSDKMNVLFFNEQDGNFITKDELSERERSKTIKYLTLNEQRELRELNRTITEFLRDYANKLAKIGSGMMGNDSLKIIIIIVAIILLGAGIWFFVPGVQQAVMGGVPQIIPSNGLPITPIQR